MPFEESRPTPTQPENVSEFADNAAEEKMIHDTDIQAKKNDLIRNFDEGFATIGQHQEFTDAFRQALDDLIESTVQWKVNVEDLSQLSDKEIFDIKEKVERRLQSFNDAVEHEVGFSRTAEAVEKAREKKSDWFTERIATEEKLIVRRTNNDADIQVKAEKGKDGKPRTVEIQYAEKGREGSEATMILEGNADFFQSDAQTTRGTLAYRIRQNEQAGAYKINGVNYEIRNPAGFRQFVQTELGKLGITINTITPEQAIQAAADIVKNNLEITDEDPFGNITADEIPIDQLLMDKGKGVCRHFSVATKAVFQALQGLSQVSPLSTGKKDPLGDIVVFENEMQELSHGTLAFARGNEVTTIDPMWYKSGAQEGIDSTLDGRHGNLPSLYRTLSKTTETRPEANIFDQGSAESLIYESDRAEVTESDNQGQAMMLTIRETIQLPRLQKPEHVQNMIADLNDFLSIVINNRDEAQKPENQMVIRSIKQLGPQLVEVAGKIVRENPEDVAFKEAHAVLKFYIIPVAQSFFTEGLSFNRELIQRAQEAAKNTTEVPTMGALEEIGQAMYGRTVENVRNNLRRGESITDLEGAKGAKAYEEKELPATTDALEALCQFVTENKLDQTPLGTQLKDLGSDLMTYFRSVSAKYDPPRISGRLALNATETIRRHLA